MDVNSCSECNQQILPSVKACPNCGVLSSKWKEVDSDKKKKKNNIGSMVEAVGAIVFYLSIAAGIIIGFLGSNILLFFTWGIAGFLLWVFLKAFSEIIFILDDIRSNTIKE